MNDDIINKSKKWMYLNARPVDLARFRYHFENGSKDAVLTALEAYQNEDGGFGHGLEADSFNPNSAPIQTWVATEILWEIQAIEPYSPMVRGIIKYLASGKDFDGTTWGNTVPSNNLYPRAFWWTYQEQENQPVNYNPTVALAGFGLMCCEKEDPFYHKCTEIVKAAIDVLLNTDLCDEMHKLSCFVRLTEYCRYAKITDLFDLDYVEQVLREKILACITKDTSTWKTAYVCKPSQFMHSRESAFYETLKEIAEYECSFIEEMQQEDGTWSVNWDWGGYEEEFHLAKNWWKGDIIVKNLLYVDGIKNQGEWTKGRMIRKLYCVNLTTKQIDKMFEFYHEVLELPIQFEGYGDHDGVKFGFGEDAFLICLWKEQNWGAGKGPATIAVRGDLDRIRQQLIDHGYQNVEISHKSYGDALIIFDPDGNQLSIM